MDKGKLFLLQKNRTKGVINQLFLLYLQALK
jgi:hypothetical protein